FCSGRAGRATPRQSAALSAAPAVRARVLTLPDSPKDPDEFLRAAGPDAASRWEELASRARSGFEAGMAEDSAGLNPSNPDQVEMVAGRLREWIRQFPESLRDGYAEAAERHTGISRHLLLRDPEPAPVARPANGARSSARVPGKKVTAGNYLVQLLAVRPAAFDRVRTKLTPQELDSGDRAVFVRMLASYERGGPAGLEADLSLYPAE